MTSEHTSLEKCTSHTLFEMVAKGLRKGYVWEMSWRLNRDCNILTPPQFLCLLQHFSLVLLGCSTGGPESPALCWELVFTASNCNNWLQTNWTSCRTGLYHCLTATCFLWASHLHPIQSVHSQVYTLISSTGFTCSLIDGWVGGQYVTNFTVWK